VKFERGQLVRRTNRRELYGVCIVLGVESEGAYHKFINAWSTKLSKCCIFRDAFLSPINPQEAESEA
jgi:hypothetical protein